MGEPHRQNSAGRSSFARYLVVAIAAALAGFGAVYVTFGPAGNGAPERGLAERQAEPAAAKPEREGLARFANGEMVTFIAKASPAPLPAVSFQDGTGAQKTIADWQGKVVLLNLWATWCAPCRKEMPSLDRLQGALGSDGFEVVAVSIDKGGLDLPRFFLEKIGIEHLRLFNDPTAKLGIKLLARGMPTTLLIDRQGREIGRLVGPAEWDSEDAKALLREAIGQASG